jgi:hypothetical protein
MYDIPYNEVDNYTTYQIPMSKNFSMWHVGLHLLTAASNVYQNGAEWCSTGAQLNDYR